MKFDMIFMCNKISYLTYERLFMLKPISRSHVCEIFDKSITLRVFEIYFSFATHKWIDVSNIDENVKILSIYSEGGMEFMQLVIRKIFGALLYFIEVPVFSNYLSFR